MKNALFALQMTALLVAILLMLVMLIWTVRPHYSVVWKPDYSNMTGNPGMVFDQNTGCFYVPQPENGAAGSGAKAVPGIRSDAAKILKDYGVSLPGTPRKWCPAD